MAEASDGGDAITILITARQVDELTSQATDTEIQAIIFKADLTSQFVRNSWRESRGSV